MRSNPSSATALARAAAALICGLCSAAGPGVQAAVSVGGSWGLEPPGSIGPGDTALPLGQLFIGSGADGLPGQVAVNQGSFLQLANLYLDRGEGLVTGAGSRMLLVSDGSPARGYSRLYMGNDTGSQASFTVSAGGLLDTSTQMGGCLAAFHYCDSFVGLRAGAQASLLVTGAGSVARIGSQLFVGHPGVFVDDAGKVFGQQGGTVTATVEVRDGAALVVDRAQVGTAQWETFNSGQESSISRVLVSGGNSRWSVVGGPAWSASQQAVQPLGASVDTANDRLAVAFIDIEQGGVMSFAPVAGRPSVLNLTTGGGHTEMTVRGAGSALTFDGSDGVLQVGRQGGSARLQLLSGGQATGLFYTAVGRDGSSGELVVDGAGSLLRMSAVSTVAANGAVFSSGVGIGRNGSGVVTVSNGGRIEVAPAVTVPGNPFLELGSGAASSGQLTITGAGSTVLVRSQSALAGGGPGEADNPWVRIGREGNGTLNLLAGGQLLLEGGAVSTRADPRGTVMYIGGSSDTTPGGKGMATVSGAGSLLQVGGSDAALILGVGPGASGSLAVSDSARVAGTYLVVGRSGGTGRLTVDHARVELSGQFSSDATTGAVMVVGRSGGTGTVDIGNGSTVLLSNPGANGGGVTLGGSAAAQLGNGTLNLTGGSTLQVQAAPGRGALTVGFGGTGLMNVGGASTVALGSGALTVARLAGSNGTLLVSEGSRIEAGWVGVGRVRTGTEPVTGKDGGTATLLLRDSTLTAPQVVVGSQGLLGGSGRIVGNVLSHGTLSPGHSPGTLAIDGDFTAADGSRLVLEVQADGHGGFATDQLLFGEASVVSLAGLAVEFHFLGSTDPGAFRAAGRFDIDSFLQRQDAGGGLSALSGTTFDGVHFSALSDTYTFHDFRYAPGSMPTFTLTVPEPSSGALMLAGGVLMGWCARRRSAGTAGGRPRA